MKGNNMIKFNLTKEERNELREHISCLLANGLSDVCGFVAVDYNEDAYMMSDYELQKEGLEPCHEDVEAQMLLNGMYLILIDEDDEKHHLTLNKILKLNIDWEKLENEGDFYDNNAILQEAIYGEVIYG